MKKKVYFSYQIVCECEFAKDTDDSAVVITRYNEKGEDPGLTVKDGMVEIPIDPNALIELDYCGERWFEFFKFKGNGKFFIYLEPINDLPITIKPFETMLSCSNDEAVG